MAMFRTDSKLLESAAARLSRRSDIYWITGGACSGKSTVCSELAELTGIHVIDMDQYIYGSWMGRYSPDRHPACTAWLGETGGLGWVMSLSPEDFDSLNRAACAEYLDLFSQYLTGETVGGPVLVDGGISHPSVLARVIPPERILCLAVEDGVSRHHWETDPERAFMKKSVQELSGIPEPWEKFLLFDRNMNRTMRTEAQAEGIRVLFREQGTAPDSLAALCMDSLGIFR